jgi:glycosyltransferase involved in cell wall biosynthesis
MSMSETNGRKNILYYCGGFHYIGGVETFVASLVLSVPDELGERWIAAWSGPLNKAQLLDASIKRSQRFARTSFRWGCRWAWPDKILLRSAWSMAQECDLLLFPKVMPHEVHYRLRSIRKPDGRPIPSILVVPYRPAEMWSRGVPQRLLECFDTIVLTSPSFVKEIRDLGYKGRAEYISLFSTVTSKPAVDPNPADATIRFGFLGRLVHQKNLPYMMKVIEALGQKAAWPFELHMFGDGLQRGDIEQIIGGSPFLSGHVKLHGMVKDEKKWDAIDSCHIFLNTATTEGQPVAVLEILSRGRPLVATGVGGLPDILDTPELGGLMPLDDPGAAASAIIDAVQRFKDRQITTSRILEIFQQRFGREVTLEKWVRLLSEMLESSPAPVGRA